MLQQNNVVAQEISSYVILSKILFDVILFRGICRLYLAKVSVTIRMVPTTLLPQTFPADLTDTELPRDETQNIPGLNLNQVTICDSKYFQK